MDDLTTDDLDALVALRRDLHRHPEVSGAEVETAARVTSELRALGIREVHTGLGGHGVAAVIQGRSSGPTVLLRCELDALPIQEAGAPDWVSTRPGTAHLCGHDGHMACLFGAARLLSRQPPPRGRVILLFQPAEEIGTGAIAVCSDPRFEALKPDWAFALHNLPDIPRGQAHVPQGLVSAPSVGLLLQLSGLEAHASTPEAGRSPAPAVAQLMDALPALSHGTFPAPDFKLVTLCHAALGTPAFGIAPGQAEMRVTCRTTSDADLEGLVQDVQALAQDAASRQGLDLKVTHQDPFLAGINDPKAAAILTEAAQDVGLSVSSGTPLRASEDFGRFGHGARAAMLLLGAGPGPMLHHPEYDFDDGLIAPGATLLANGARLALAAQKS